LRDVHGNSLLLAWLFAGVLLVGCASTRTGQVARDVAQCRNAFDVRVTLELSTEDEFQVRSSHPCPDAVFQLHRAGSVRISAPDRPARGWISLASREAIATGPPPPLWNPNTMSVWVQTGRAVRPEPAPAMGPGDFLLFASRQAGEGPVLALISATGEVVAEEPLAAGFVSKTGSYSLALLLDILTLPFAPFIILFGAMGA
jgi:hypothetical protein